MAYNIGARLGMLDKDLTLDEIVKMLIYEIPKKDAVLFLEGLEDTYAKRGLETNKEKFLVKAAKLALKISELDQNKQFDARALERIKEYETQLAKKELYGYATEVAGLIPTPEAWERIRQYAGKCLNNVHELGAVQMAMFGNKKVYQKMGEEVLKRES